VTGALSAAGIGNGNRAKRPCGTSLLGGLAWRVPKAAGSRRVTAGFIIASGSTLPTPKPSTPRKRRSLRSVWPWSLLNMVLTEPSTLRPILQIRG